MGINVASSFTRNAPVPLDDATVVADLTARDAIASGVRYEGMEVYVVSEETNYQLRGGIANGNWEESGSGGGAGGGAALILKSNDSQLSPSLITTIPIDYWAYNNENETLWTKFTVPAGYKPGKNINLENFKLFVDSTDTTKNLQPVVEVYLFKDGTSPLSLSNADDDIVTGGLPVAVPAVANDMVDSFVSLAPLGVVNATDVDPGDLIILGIRMNRVVPVDASYQGQINMIDNTLNLNFNAS